MVFRVGPFVTMDVDAEGAGTQFWPEKVFLHQKNFPPNICVVKVISATLGLF